MNINDAYKNLYPLTIVMDRYTGIYSGGIFTAWNLDPDEVPVEICCDDSTALDFFNNTTFVYGIGGTPDEAVMDLYIKNTIELLLEDMYGNKTDYRSKNICASLE